MSIQSPSVGVLDIKNATLRVGKLEVASVQGIDASLNTFKANSILLFDDQRPDTTRAFTTSGSAVYNSGNISLAGGAIYTGLGLPNAWVAEFEMAAPATGEGSSSVSFEFYSTDSIGGGGYKLNFNTDTDPQKIELSYNGTAITSANVDAGIEQVGYRKYVIIYERGAISVSIDGTRYFYHNDIERAGPYTVGTGGFVRFACAGTGLTRDLRKIKISNDGPWNFAASSSDIAYLNGNVGIGTNAPGYTLDVNGDINFSGNFYQGGSPFVSSEWTTGSESLYYRSNVEIGTANLFVDTTTSNVGIGTTIPGYTLDVNGDINFSGNFYQGGSPFVSSEWTTGSESLYYRSNVEIGTANLFVDTTTSNVGIGTTIPGYTLDVNGDINFSGNFYQGGSPFVSSEWTTGSESLYYRSNVEIGTANLFVDTTTGRVGVGTMNPQYALDVNGAVNVEANVYAPNLPLAQIASNLVTWNSTTGDLMDSGGLITNKLAIVSEQPPSALTAASTTIADHGVYKVTASVNATTAHNVFNKTGTSWTGSADYTGASSVYAGTTRLASSTPQGDWISLELPYKATLRHLTVTAGPLKANLFATNDNITWTELADWSSASGTVIVNATATYKKYAVVATQLSSGSTLTFDELRFFAESFSIDGGKVAMASAAITGGNTVVDQTGPHARHVVPLRKYPEVALTSNVQAGYVVSSSTAFNSLYTAWKAFNGNPDTGTGNGSDSWVSAEDAFTSGTANSNYGFDFGSGQVNGPWIRLDLPQNIILSHVDVWKRSSTYDQFPKSGYIYGYDGSSWQQLTQFTNITNPSQLSSTRITFSSSTAVSSVVMLITERYNGTGGDTSRYVIIKQLEYYGYEETSDPDTSVDTTITSQFNLPDTTGVKLYIDGDKGSTATDYSGQGHTLTENNATYDSTDKAWSFTSLATSNVTSDDLGFEGDRPHSVSLWFNAANVSSNATLFHVGTAAGEGDAKTAISLTETGHLGWIDGGDNQFLSANTWHNLVYATQGAGGVRTCYLDGRKLGDVQVQDTFGDYPPFAMTTYSEYGYTVSASSDLTTDYHAWEVFDDGGVEGWICDDYNSDGTTPRYTGGITSSGGGVYQGPISTISIPITGSGSETIEGEYIQVEFPFKFKLEDIAYQREGTYWGYNRLPHSGSIVACNDGINWKTIHNWTGLTDADVGSTDGSNLAVTQAPFRSGIFAVDKSGATYDAYKFFRIICTRIQKTNTLGDGGSYGLWSVWQLELYGHKENDTTRFPVSSTVLKYPHIAMTGPAQRGYVVTVSSAYSSAYDGHYALNEILSPSNQGNSYWSSADHYTSAGAWDTTYNTDTYKTTASGTDYYGDFIEVEFPRKITLSYITIHPVTTAQNMVNRLPSAGVVAGWNGSSWDAIQTYTSLSVSASTHNILNVNASTAYSKIRLVVTTLQTNVSLEYEAVAIDILRFYGTEEDLDVVARVGEGLDGKVANFRVYDKYLHEEQALELWDAQKDQFGRATSSVSVYRGHVGIGTTTPSAALTVMDEPGDMEEFPPRAMTGYETHMEGHGVFKASASSEYSYEYLAHQAFNKITTSGTIPWISAGNSTDDTFHTSTGLALSRDSFEGTNGPWIKLELPYNVKPQRVQLHMRNTDESTSARKPKSGVVYGYKSGMYHKITHFDFGSTDKDILMEELQFNVDEYYSKFVLQITSMYLTGNSKDAIAIKGINYFGTRQGQSTLHDGSLTLTKNLTVPRIGPALDADDTPRRDRLVVEYNTSTNPTENGMVRDTSGRGFDGLMFGGAYYDASEKALVFDGVDDYIDSTALGFSGDQVISTSFWIKSDVGIDGLSSGQEYGIFHIGSSSAGLGVSLFNDASGIGDTLWIWVPGKYSYYSVRVEANRWYHITVVYGGGGIGGSNVHLYIDNVKINRAGTSGTTTTTPVFTTTHTLRIGDWFDGSSPFYRWDGSISNFKLYDVALTATEVKRLYDMGRCDEGHHVVNFSKTRVGIGLGDGEAPRADLDVRGTLRIPTEKFGSGLTAQGMLRFNTTLSRLQVHNGSEWVTVGGVSATGGTVTYASGYTIHTFTSSGTFTVYSGGDVEYLVVAGGGGGGGNVGGGGGAGGLLAGTHTGLTTGAYTITVGPGGAGGAANVQGTNGTNSSALGYTATGGGGGGKGDFGGSAGGSGGGGAGKSQAGATSGGTGVTGQGNAGGTGTDNAGTYSAGGGGGAGAAGAAGVQGGAPGNGGAGLVSSITGTSTYYAGGGGGASSTSTSISSGGSSIGGIGGRQAPVANATGGTDETGSGGGGGGGTGGSGGDGIVIIRYLT